MRKHIVLSDLEDNAVQLNPQQACLHVLTVLLAD